MINAAVNMNSARQVRDELAQALRLDLVGPWAGHELESEWIVGWERPSEWYLTGFLVPTDTPADEREDGDQDDDPGVAPESAGLAEESTEDARAAKKRYLPSSMGLSFLVGGSTERLTATIRWGDYEEVPLTDEDGKQQNTWQRRQVAVAVDLELSPSANEQSTTDVPGSGGLQLVVVEHSLPTEALSHRVPPGTRSLSVFLVNRRPAIARASGAPDSAYAFQAELEIRTHEPLVSRPDLSGLHSHDGDDALADLHYSDVPEYATGHGVSADWEMVGGECRLIRTEWMPTAELERTVAGSVEGVQLQMEELGRLDGAAAVHSALDPLVRLYRTWIEAQRDDRIRSLSGSQNEISERLLEAAEFAARRIERGVTLLADDPDALDAFRVANRAVAGALRRRLKEQAPGWRPFQLAFILLNLPGLADADDPDRQIVDLLFFPTGGGKTEAYLGLSAFAMVLRRLRSGGELGGCGTSVVMRYTLRLLTLDQLGRAAGLVCALEIERHADPARLGMWPFEIGLWVGQAATPNVLGYKGDNNPYSARSKLHRYRANPRGNPPPIPLEECPWCGASFEPESFALLPNDDSPAELRVGCVNPECDFTRDRPLPIVAVDEMVYRRLPAFLIATVDKFAALPWVGVSGLILGGADRYDAEGFYGPADPKVGTPLGRSLASPDLIIQDELHLITGPLGTMAGLYETAIDALCTRVLDGRSVQPKIVASTATVRRAADQIQALFGRSLTQVFPPPGPDRRDSFFAQAAPPGSAGRLYVGIGVQGRNPKVVMRRTLVTLLCAAEHEYQQAGGAGSDANPADPYMTALCYFNSLRELGGARRIVEEEVQNTIKGYGARRRIGEEGARFRDRKRMREVLELTSRVSTSEVAAARRALGNPFRHEDHVDVALATNMISVGLDIPRLGLMVVLGQPKTNAEYIQATSRVGRDHERPGLVVTLLNFHKPRDRSHYERFRHYHETFYRSVEASSVTPFSARALDRGLAGAVVALARHLNPTLTPARGVEKIAAERLALEPELLGAFLSRVRLQPGLDATERLERERSVQTRLAELLRAWLEVVKDHNEKGVSVQYQKREFRNLSEPRPLLRDLIDTGGQGAVGQPSEEPPSVGASYPFRIGRSLREVEPTVTIFVE